MENNNRKRLFESVGIYTSGLYPQLTSTNWRDGTILDKNPVLNMCSQSNSHVTEKTQYTLSMAGRRSDEADSQRDFDGALNAVLVWDITNL